MSGSYDLDRRQLLSTLALAVAGVELGAAPATARRFGLTQPLDISTGPQPLLDVRQIDAGVLNVGYAEVGPGSGPPIILLHGFPYDIHSYGEVAPRLAAKGYRVIVPYVRGSGTTRFLS